MSDKKICKKVLEKILNIEIKYIEMPTEQKVIDILLNSKAVRLDIYVNDENGTIYNVEMQKGKRKNLAKRSRYYQGSIDLDLISKGEDYNKLNKSFVIFICTFDPFDRGRHLYTFENRCNEDTTLTLGDETVKVFLNTKGSMSDVDQEMLDFLNYIENSTDDIVINSGSELLELINEKVKFVKDNKSMEVEYMTLYEREREKYQEGKEEGIKIGEELGKEETKIEIAIALLNILEDEVIAGKTGLSIDKVKELRSQSNKK